MLGEWRENEGNMIFTLTMENVGKMLGDVVVRLVRPKNQQLDHDFSIEKSTVTSGTTHFANL